jgi:biopolymer transport protein ExbB
LENDYDKSNDMSFLEWILAGGWVMVPLLIFSFLTWGVIFERAWTYRKIKADLGTFQSKAWEALATQDWKRLEDVCFKWRDCPSAQVLQVALEKISSSKAEVRVFFHSAAERKLGSVRRELKRYFWVLATIATASPFIGLFGTVVGILKSFRDIGLSGKSGFAIVAAGISEALVATAAGIIVAVVASIAFNVFQAQWADLSAQVREQVEELLEAMGTRLGIGDENGPSGKESLESSSSKSEGGRSPL